MQAQSPGPWHGRLETVHQQARYPVAAQVHRQRQPGGAGTHDQHLSVVWQDSHQRSLLFCGHGNPVPGMKTSRNNCIPYITRDGSSIRELLHPMAHDAVRQQSLAEATLEPGQSTARHRHRHSEEIYHILSGSGRMTLGDDSFEVNPGDSIVISPGRLHSLHNHGQQPLVLLCCCSPPYSHDDTELVDEPD